ncbi:MAG: hypothetical protein FWF01_02470, partial [Alphaproteobacteria bacterium]|nr:hypothetical protein [Alphaproteobacteria bacterium]
VYGGEYEDNDGRHVVKGWVQTANENGWNLAVPADGNLSKICHGGGYSHSPQERAAMLYEAITAQHQDGKYKYGAIFLPGGSGADETLRELEEIVWDKGPLPERGDGLKIFGFSDPTRPLRYLGQRGIAQTYIYSGFPGGLMEKYFDKTINPNGQNFDVTAYHVPPRLENGAEHAIVHPSTGCESFYKKFGVVDIRARLCDPPFENIMLCELRDNIGGDHSIESIIEGLKHPSQTGRNITLMLSKDSGKDEAAKEKAKKLVARLKEEGLGGVGVFLGAPFGHDYDVKSEYGLPAMPMYTASTLGAAKVGETTNWNISNNPLPKGERELLKKEFGRGNDSNQGHVPEEPRTNMVLVTPRNNPNPKVEGIRLGKDGGPMLDENGGYITVDAAHIAPKDGVLRFDLTGSQTASGVGGTLSSGLNFLVDKGYVNPEDIEKIDMMVDETAMDKAVESCATREEGQKHGGPTKKVTDKGKANEQWEYYKRNLNEYTVPNASFNTTKIGREQETSKCACGVNTTCTDSSGSSCDKSYGNRLMRFMPQFVQQWFKQSSR